MRELAKIFLPAFAKEGLVNLPMSPRLFGPGANPWALFNPLLDRGDMSWVGTQ